MAAYSVAITHEMAGQKCLNVIGFARTDLLGAETVAEAAIVAEQVAIAWKARVMLLLNSALVFQVAEARGMVNPQVSGLSISASVAGTLTGSPFPTFVAARVQFGSATPGRAGRGRTGLCGIQEDTTVLGAPNVLAAVNRTNLQNAMTNFMQDLAALTPTIFPVVISRVLNGVPRAVPIASAVTQTVVLSQLGTRVSRVR